MAGRIALFAVLGLGLVGLTSLQAAPPEVLWAGPTGGEEPTASPPAGGSNPSTSQPGAGRPSPLPGLTIDKQRRRVMVACTSLQPGVPLELIACGPNSREHESLMVVKARPQHIHLALLICGYEAGHPATWDEQAQKPIMATGDPADIQVQWTDPKTGKQRTAPIEDWLAAADPAKPVPRLNWLFTGSRRLDDGQYLADSEGSVVSISNFPDAVIDLSGAHTRDNANLEFKGSKEVMPPAGTPCTLVILPPAALRIELDRFGKVLIHGRASPPNRLADLLAAHHRSRDDARVELVVSPDAIKADVDALLGKCEDAGFKGRIDRRAPTSQPAAALFPENDPAAAWDLLAGPWRQNQSTVLQNIANQQQWLEHLKQRRDVLARQYNDLADYLSRTGQQYGDAIRQLRNQP